MSLRERVRALLGNERDPTKGPIFRAVLLLAIPMVLEMAMESLFAVVDIYWVSRLGDAATASVALTESLMTLVYTLAMGLSIGVTAVVARRIGEGAADGAGEAAVQAVLLGVGISLVSGVLGAIYAPELLGLMGADQEVIQTGTPYARLMLGANVVIMLLFLQNAAFRGAGDAVAAMLVLWLANGLNLILDPLLIFGLGPFPELGVKGAAVATCIGRGCAVLAQLVLLFRGTGKLRVRRSLVRVLPAVMARLVRLSGTGTLQVFIATASWIALVRLAASFGTEALAGYQVAIRVILFAILPAWGISNAASTMVGQSLGAGDPARAERAVWTTCGLNFAFLGLVGCVCMAFSSEITALFGLTQEAMVYAEDGLRIVSAGYVFFAFGMVLGASFNGAGDVWTPTWINLFCYWMLEIPLAWALAFPAGLGVRGVYLAMTISFSMFAIASALIFRRGSWKTKKV